MAKVEVSQESNEAAKNLPIRILPVTSSTSAQVIKTLSDLSSSASPSERKILEEAKKLVGSEGKDS